MTNIHHADKRQFISRVHKQLRQAQTCSGHSTTFYGFFDSFLVRPAEIRKPADIGRGLHRGSLPEAGEVMPVRDLPVEHGGLRDTE